jgi:hypothetical protein
MPIFLNHGSTSRPPGEYHLRHSFKEISDNLESPYPPFHIFSIETTNNNNNNIIICYDNSGTQKTINYNTSTYNDNKEADNAYSTHRTDKINKKWFDLLVNNNNNNNIDKILELLASGTNTVTSRYYRQLQPGEP